MATYQPLQSIVLTAATSSVTFSGIDQSYTDLIFVCNVTGNTGSNGDLSITFNGDVSSGLYSRTVLDGNGTTTVSSRGTSANFIYLNYNGAINSSNPSNYIINLNNYSNTTTYKSVLVKSGNSSIALAVTVGLWKNTAAITSSTITVSTSFAAGSTFSLYGIKSGSPKATGGQLFTDGNYWYHVFTQTQSFIPTQSLSCEVTATGGGGAGGFNNGGGGGSGELKVNSSLSVTAQTYAITIGSGGTGATSTGSRGGSGTSSTITIGGTTYLTALGGGGGGTSDGTGGNNNGATGGSGGGSSISGTAGTASGSNTFAGGAGAATADNYSGGGGGGATAAGVAGTLSPSKGGNGGQGYSLSSIGSYFTTLLSPYTVIASGGGGGNYSGTNGTGGTGAGNGGLGSTVATSGTSYGSGGGGGGYPDPYRNGGAGAAGIVIVRYPV
jgi:hypothetical protein